MKYLRIQSLIVISNPILVRLLTCVDVNIRAFETITGQRFPPSEAKEVPA